MKLPFQWDDANTQHIVEDVGYSNKNVIRFLAFTLRNNEIRVFSCRIANKKERAKYYEINQGKIGNNQDGEGN